MPFLEYEIVCWAGPFLSLKLLAGWPLLALEIVRCAFPILGFEVSFIWALKLFAGRALSWALKLFAGRALSWALKLFDGRAFS